MNRRNWSYFVYWMEEDGEHCNEWIFYESAEKDFTEKVQAGYQARLSHVLPNECHWDGEEQILMETL